MMKKNNLKINKRKKGRELYNTLDYNTIRYKRRQLCFRVEQMNSQKNDTKKIIQTLATFIVT